MDWLLDAPSYLQLLQSVPVDLACDVIRWAYLQEMGRWSEEDLLISVDLDDGYHCNGAYGGVSHMRVAVETICDAKECRFHLFVAGDIAAGEEIIYNYRAFAVSSSWTEFGL